MACGDVLSLEDLQTAKKHQLFEAEVITGKAGGVAGGADIDYATNQVTGQTQKTMPAVLRDVGFVPASFTFTTGGTLGANDRDKAVFDPVSKAWYTWVGALPKVVPASTNPVGDVNWKPWTDPTLRSDLTSSGGSLFVTGSSPAIESFTGLRASLARYDGDLRTLIGYRAGSVKGAGQFKWVAASTIPDDGGSRAAVSGVPTGRWVRIVSGPYTPEMYGADGTKSNDPDAIFRLLSNQKLIQFFGGRYYYDREFVTNGHTISGVTAETFDVDNTGTHIVFFGNFSANQAYRNGGKKTALKGIVFEPESWDVITGYTGSGMRLFRTVDAENCYWNKFKQFGMDLWEDVANAYVPYYSQFRNCGWDYNGYNGIRLAQGANALQIYGGVCRWNGAPAYNTAPINNSTGWDGLYVGHVTEAGVPAPDNPFATQGLIIEGIDCAYNARYGANINYCNQSRIHIGYCEANLQGVDVRIADVIACDINILQSQQGADVAVPLRGYGVPRSDANYPNRIIVNGKYYGGGSKDAQGRYIDYGNLPKQGLTVLAAGTVGATYIRARSEGDGSVEFLADTGVQVLYRCPPVSLLPTAGEKWLGVIVRNTSVGPNPLQVCVEQAPGVYVWRTITTS
jgi:Tail spike TSP1/Gp66 receptor binding N-terminal domain